MNSKQKAIENLKKQIRLERERLGPDGIKELEKLAKNIIKPERVDTLPAGMVPYDKKAAIKAFEIFLKNHGDPEEFERRLREMIRKSSH
ncbi:MAG: hypothetical protein KAS59_06630 [Alphaproteobacteria bacterium]|nr:hypothetical protein [Alphaproteobacteria bacterium]MCK5555106.1 hypothetical protein [Alphaproteobacteria bacterium]MCK5658965.1 hypothetical protein [Alphaproteobacteria bacterium]